MDCFPLPQGTYYRSSGYRTEARPKHNGIDLAAPDWTPLVACISGRVTIPAEEPGGAGKNIWIDDGKVWWKYFHMAAISVVNGQHVDAGDIVGAVGHTGGVLPPGPAGAHLHIERHTGGPSKPTDPTKYLDGCERAGHWPTAHIAQPTGDEPLLEEDKQFIRDEIANQLHAAGMGQLQLAANMGAVVHHDLNELCKRLGVDELPEYTVNVGGK